MTSSFNQGLNLNLEIQALWGHDQSVHLLLITRDESHAQLSLRMFSKENKALQVHLLR